MTSSLSEVFSWVMSRFKFFHYGHHICWQSPEHTTFSIIQHHSASFSTSASLQREHVKLVKLVAMPRGIQSHSATPGGIGCDAGRLPCANSRKKSWEQICFSLLQFIGWSQDDSGNIMKDLIKSFTKFRKQKGYERVPHCHIFAYAEFSEIQGPWTRPRSWRPKLANFWPVKAVRSVRLGR